MVRERRSPIEPQHANWREEFEAPDPDLAKQLARLRYEEIGANIVRPNGDYMEPVGHILPVDLLKQEYVFLMDNGAAALVQLISVISKQGSLPVMKAPDLYDRTNFLRQEFGVPSGVMKTDFIQSLRRSDFPQSFGLEWMALTNISGPVDTVQHAITRSMSGAEQQILRRRAAIGNTARHAVTQIQQAFRRAE